MSKYTTGEQALMTTAFRAGWIAAAQQTFNEHTILPSRGYKDALVRFFKEFDNEQSSNNTT